MLLQDDVVVTDQIRLQAHALNDHATNRVSYACVPAMVTEGRKYFHGYLCKSKILVAGRGGLTINQVLVVSLSCKGFMELISCHVLLTH